MAKYNEDLLGIRCSACRHVFDPPETEQGEVPGPLELVVCPNCSRKNGLAFYGAVYADEECDHNPYDAKPWHRVQRRY